MTEEQEQQLTEKLTRIGYSAFEVLPGEDDILMLHIQDRLIGGVLYALSLSDDDLKKLIDETVKVGMD